MELPFAEAYKIKMVEPLRKSTRAEREQWIKDAHYNLFGLKSEMVISTVSLTLVLVLCLTVNGQL